MSIFLVCLFSIWGCESDKGVQIYNSAPQAVITSHTDGDELLEAVEYTFVGQVSDTNHNMSELLVVWSTDDREICPETAPDVTGLSTCTAVLEAGESQLKMQVTDPERSSGIDSISISVAETNAPTIELLSPVVGAEYYSDQLIFFAATSTTVTDVPRRNSCSSSTGESSSTATAGRTGASSPAKTTVARNRTT